MKKKCLYISIGIICSVALVFGIYFIFIEVKIKEFTSMDLTEIKTEGNFIRLRDANIYYVEKGTGSNIVVLIHGLGGGTFSYRNNIDALAENGNKVYAIDLKGFGYSEKVAGSDYSHQEQAKIVLEFLDKKGIDKATFVGHSMGGSVILLAYGMQPEKFAGIVLIDSAGLDNPPQTALSKILNQPLVDILYYNLFANKNNLSKFLKSAYYNEQFVDDNLVNMYMAAFRIKNANKAFLGIMKTSQVYDIESILKLINVPVLIIWGKNDSWINIESGYKFKSLIENSRLEVIPDAGHLPMEEQPDMVNKIIVDFLK